MSVTVVKVHPNQNNFTHYIGRRWAGFLDSPYRNRFRIGLGSREDAVIKFTIWWFAPAQKELRLQAIINIPDDAVLGCWCHPSWCHGDIIAGYLNWKRNQYAPRLFE